MHAVFLVVMEELNGGKIHMVGFLLIQAVVHGLAIWLNRRAVETSPVNGIYIWCSALWNFEGCIKLRHQYPSEEVASRLEGGWNQQVDISLCCLDGHLGT